MYYKEGNYKENKLVVAERFKKTSKGKIYRKMISTNKISYLGYLNKTIILITFHEHQAC